MTMNVLNLFHMRTKNYQQNNNYLNQEITNSKLRGFFFIVKVQCTCSTTLDFSLLSVYFDNTTLNNSTFFSPNNRGNVSCVMDWYMFTDSGIIWFPAQAMANLVFVHEVWFFVHHYLAIRGCTVVGYVK